jgi:predicted Zn finger-like uncharacterized protein
MKVSCPSCRSTLSIDDKKVPATGARIKCPTCQNIFPVKPAGSVPLPGAAAAPGVPLPGSAAPTATVPLPGAASTAPAGSPSRPRFDWQDEPTRAGAQPQRWQEDPTRAVPLPGAAAPFGSDEPTRIGPASGAVPLPGTAQNPAFEPPRASSAAVPLPGTTKTPAFEPPRASSTAAVPLPGTTKTPAFEPPRAGPAAVPLPGSASAPDFVPGPARAEAAVPLPGAASRGARSAASAVPLPGAAFAPEPEETHVTSGSASGQRAVPLPGSADDELEFDVSSPSASSISLPPPPSFDFEVPSPASEEEEPPREPPGFDFSAPADPAPGAFDFSAPESLGFETSPPLPSSSAPSAFDGPPMGFGEVDLGGGGGASPGQDLEFDPTGGPSAHEELEADLNAPLPAAATPVGPVDGLEMLSFIDDTAQEAGVRRAEPSGVRRFHVKRRSGKVFGPFEEAVIVKMLEDGQLLGNEEVSLDAESWQPVGSEPAFQPVIARLMEGPSSATAATATPAPSDDRPRGPSMERLKQLYEGRMAAVAVVQSKEPVPFKKRLPYIAAGAAVLAMITAGVMVGVSTPYGYFGLKLLFPAKVRTDTREAGYLDAARQGLLADTWRGLTGARDSANQALAIKEFPEARAIWSQAVFALKRKYGKASAEDLAKATSELQNIKLLGEKHPEVLKAFASEALARRSSDEALGFLGDALARDSGDLEAAFLRAEAYLQKKQPGQAKSEYEQLLKKRPKSARALHALGLLHRTQSELDEATESFEAALEADPAHLASAIELAELAIVSHRDVAKGASLLAPVLEDKAKATLAPAEAAKALALEAEALVVQGKLAQAVPLFEAALKADASNGFTQARLGNVYLQLHEADKAAPLLKQAVASSPESLDYAESYLSALIALGKMDEAQKVVQSVTSRFPGNAMLAYLSGRVAEAIDNAKEAEASYRRAIAADPKLTDAYLYLARLHIRFRRFGEAKPVLESGLEQAPENASLKVGMGELAFHERDLDRAQQELQGALELDPTLAAAHLGASKVYLERGKLDLAASAVGRALELDPRLPGGRLQHGVVLWKLGRLEEAVEALENALKDDDRDLQVKVTLGAVELDRGDFKKARAYLAQALASNASDADANFYLARVEHAESHSSQAIDSMKRALDFNAKNPVYHYWMGRILSDARKGDDALAEWKRALELDPTYADALEVLGRAYFERNELRKAVKNYQQALASDPGRNAVQVAIGDVQMKMDDWDGAIASYTKALDRDPTVSGVHYQMGLAYEEKRQPKKAIESYLRAVQVEANAADPWRQLGWLYKGQGKKKEALAAFRKYLASRPEAEDKKQIEDELYFLEH